MTEMQPAMLAVLTDAANRAAESSEALTHEYRKQRRRIWILLGGVVVTAAAVVLLSVVAVTNRTVLDEVRSCTTPSGECAQRGQESTAKAIQAINDHQRRVVEATVLCILELPRPVNQDRLHTCVDSHLVTAGPTSTR